MTKTAVEVLFTNREDSYCGYPYEQLVHILEAAALTGYSATLVEEMADLMLESIQIAGWIKQLQKKETDQEGKRKQRLADHLYCETMYDIARIIHEDPMHQWDIERWEASLMEMKDELANYWLQLYDGPTKDLMKRIGHESARSAMRRAWRVKDPARKGL